MKHIYSLQDVLEDLGRTMCARSERVININVTGSTPEEIKIEIETEPTTDFIDKSLFPVPNPTAAAGTVMPAEQRIALAMQHPAGVDPGSIPWDVSKSFTFTQDPEGPGLAMKIGDNTTTPISFPIHPAIPNGLQEER